jgi:hypothetical protein
MGNAQRVKARSAREKIAAQQARGRRPQLRRRALIAGGSVAIVLVLVVVLVVVRLTRPPAHAGPAAADAVVAREVTSVPPATFSAVGAGTATGLKATSGQPALMRNGKPEVLYMGGEFCPFCAAERWAIAAALGRFGTLSGLTFIRSSPTDTDANTPTLSFVKARYTSKYLSFVPVEWYGEAVDSATPFGHVYLQHPTPQETALFAKYAGGSVPFVDIANQYLVPQAQYLPSALAGLTWAQVAAAMHDPSSAVGRDIDGAANKLTKAICQVTHGQPGSVCSSAGVTAAGT